MRRTLYDSRSIPLDILFRLAEAPRGMFGDPEPVIADTRDAPEVSEQEEAQ